MGEGGRGSGGGVRRWGWLAGPRSGYSGPGPNSRLVEDAGCAGVMEHGLRLGGGTRSRGGGSSEAGPGAEGRGGLLEARPRSAPGLRPRSGALPGRASLPERGGGAAEVQGRQALGAEQVGVGAVLQQQLDAGRVASQAGLVQGSLAARAGVGVCTAAEQVAHAGGVAAGRRDAQRGGELALVL